MTICGLFSVITILLGVFWTMGQACARMWLSARSGFNTKGKITETSLDLSYSLEILSTG